MNDQPAETTEAAGVRHLRPDGAHCGYYGFVVCNKCGWADPVPASARVAAREATACELGSPGWALLSPNDAIAIALAAAAPHIAATERERERERLLSALTSWLPQYVCSVVHGRTADGDPVYASGAVAFPEALVTTFTIMYDHDLTGGQP